MRHLIYTKNLLPFSAASALLSQLNVKTLSDVHSKVPVNPLNLHWRGGLSVIVTPSTQTRHFRVYSEGESIKVSNTGFYIIKLKFKCQTA